MDKQENAKISIGNSIFITILSSLLITFIYLLFSDLIITIFGGTVNNETFKYAKEYFFLYHTWNTILYVWASDESYYKS